MGVCGKAAEFVSRRAVMGVLEHLAMGHAWSGEFLDSS